jgi:AraC family transcriptional regulator of adaptative response/methylated-DNA-[protein]-cysteine methyltransferase
MMTVEPSRPSIAEMRRACADHDPGYDGVFFFAVRTTGIVCRPSCPSRPMIENVEFFDSLEAALAAGYRPCKRCRPELANGRTPEWIASLMNKVFTGSDGRVAGKDIKAAGLSPERVRRWFKRNMGMSFAEWSRARRMGMAHNSLKTGAPLDEAAMGHGYESHSGFREAFEKTFGMAPGQARAGDCLRVAVIAGPLGPMLAAADERALCFLEFVAEVDMARIYRELKEIFQLPLVPGTNTVLKKLESELAEYFAGQRKNFTTPLRTKGTSFQEKVWEQLRKIPSGATTSYGDVARRIGRPSAVRAVARANAANRICILIPCHRVIAASGAISGYAGGVWRKRKLLEIEGKRPCSPAACQAPVGA